MLCNLKTCQSNGILWKVEFLTNEAHLQENTLFSSITLSLQKLVDYAVVYVLVSHWHGLLLLCLVVHWCDSTEFEAKMGALTSKFRHAKDHYVSQLHLLEQLYYLPSQIWNISQLIFHHVMKLLWEKIWSSDAVLTKMKPIMFSCLQTPSSLDAKIAECRQQKEAALAEGTSQHHK